MKRTGKAKLAFLVGILFLQATALAQNAGDLYSTDNIVGKMRYVPAGIFTQGSPVTEPGRNPDENQFSHFLTKNIAVMETAVTVQMWADLRLVQTSLPADPSGGWGNDHPTRPAQCVTWHHAILFANLLSIQSGLTPCYYADSRFTVLIDITNFKTGSYFCNFDANGFRLPTEGEREYFARAGTAGAFSIDEPNYSDSTYGICTAGSLPALETMSWFCANSYDGLKDVGTKNANPWNLKDAHGDVMEWCWDIYGPYPSANAADFRGAPSGYMRVIRGGAWSFDARIARSAHRFCRVPNFSNDMSVGFRLVRTIDPVPASVVTVTFPAGGESWWVGSAHPIDWTATDDINYINIEYSTNNGTNWALIAASVPYIGRYDWTVPNTPSSSCLIRISNAANPATLDLCAANFSIIAVPAPVIYPNRVEVNFYAASGQTSLPSQWLTVGNSGGGTLSWSASASAGWVTVAPSSGSGNGKIKIDANPSGLSPGIHNATITISDPQAANSSQTVYVILNVSSGTEEPYFTVEMYNYALRGWPIRASFIDFDSDGDKDIVFDEAGFSGGPEPQANGRISAFRNDGLGNFTDATAEVFLGSNFVVAGAALLIADFNGDGRDDLFAVESYADSIPFPGGDCMVFVQTADGRLKNETDSRLPYVSRLYTAELVTAAGDIDGDGDIDVYAAANGLLINNGNGSFIIDTSGLPPVASPRDPNFRVQRSCCLIDVDRDGDLDLFIGTGGPAPIDARDIVLLNDGVGHFAEAPADILPPRLLGMGSATGGCVSADFDGDGYQDLALAVVKDDPVSGGAAYQLLLNNGDCTFRDVSSNIPAGPVSLNFYKGDVNNDGWMDFMANGFVYLNQGNAHFIEVDSQLIPFCNGNWALHPEDLDKDGDTDLFTFDMRGTYGYPETLEFLRNIRPYVTATPLPYPDAPTLISPAEGITLGTNAPTLVWNSVSTAIAYEVEVATDSNFSYLIFAKGNISPTSCKVSGLDNDTTYYWRVRAHNTRGAGAWSAIRSFFVSPITIVSPNGGENWPGGTVHDITWTAKGISGTATIDLYKNDAFNSNIGQANVSAGTYSWAVFSGLIEGNDYKIKIYQGAVSDLSDTDFSSFKARTISGHVTAYGLPVADAILGGLPGNPKTDALGFYSASVPYGWSGTVTPFCFTGGYLFEPESVNYTNITASQTSDYEAYKGIPALERAALIALYNAANGDSWTDHSGWKTQPLEADGFAAYGTEGTWHYVAVSSHRVTTLEISDLWLTGYLPPELGNLHNLIYLTLRGLTGTIPSSFANLTNLLSLTLIGSPTGQLAGNIPSFIGTFNNLAGLDLSRNKLSGNIPAEVGTLVKLRGLGLAANMLSGPVPSSIKNLTSFVPGWSDIGFNALYTNDQTVRNFLNSLDPDWEDTQTIAPTNVQAVAVNGTTVTVNWTPIRFVIYQGGYRVYYSQTSGGQYTFYGQTADKTVSSMQVTGLAPGTKYYFIVQTRTDTNGGGGQYSIIDSEYSAEVWETTPVPVLLTVTSPNGGESWAAGSVHAVTWTSSGLAGNITIDLYKGGAFNSNIGTANVSTGTYAWNIPAGLAAGTDYKVRIYQASVEDYSNADFTITAAAAVKEDFVATWDGQGVYYRNSDTGAWVKLASPATLVTVGDLYGDGIDDLIGIWPTQGGVWVKNSANGTWVKLSTTAHHIGTGDMNGDGRVDLLGTWDGQGVYYRNSMNGSWGKLASPATLVTSGDLDGDSKDDLIGIWPTQGGVWVKYSKTGAWSKLSSTARDIAAGDMNGDGRDELLATYDGQGVYYRNSFTGAWVKMATPADQVTCGDLDADGKDDLIGVWPGQGGVWVKYSKTGNWSNLSTTAKDLAAGKMRAGGGSPSPMGVLELVSPQGGFAEGPGISGIYEDRSAQGPGGRRFVYWQDKNLIPMENAHAGLRRIPGPGEHGFSCTEEPNLSPQDKRPKQKSETRRNKKY